MEIKELLQICVDRKASDLHLSTGLSPLLRIDGDLEKLDLPILEDKVLRSQLLNLMDERQRKEFEDKLETDLAISFADQARFRLNVFTQERGISGAFRLIPNKILTLEELGMPKIFQEICNAQHGLVLVSGPTGSGKSTSLAAMIDYINDRENLHILTIEDPIEYLHKSKKCLVNQREVHRDTHSFNQALRSALREDPDIILVGEMRDLETMRLALTAAETGHLVFATLHTFTAAKTINRIIDVFPGEEKALIRSMLAESLNAVISQALLKKTEGGRLAAYEIMTCTPAIRNMIREDKIPQIYSAIQTGSGHGMQSFEQHITQLVTQGLVSDQEKSAHLKKF